MKNYIVLYNPLSNNGRGESETKRLESIVKDASFEYCDLTKIEDVASFLSEVPAEKDVVLSGGDGTINRFINAISGMELEREIYYFATGTGNDFLTDINAAKGEALLPIKKYIVNLPVVEVNGKRYKFLNNVGFGIDGYCCEEGDRQRAAGEQKINYTAIAIKGLLGKYKRVNAKVTIDGVTRTYKNVWLAPSMNGRYVGGGMMACPEQDRLGEDGMVSVMVMHHRSKLKTLMVFPKIFKGEHVKHTDMVEQFKGHEVEVEFDRPTALQIDGETFTSITKYHVWATPEYRKAGIKEFAAK